MSENKSFGKKALGAAKYLMITAGVFTTAFVASGKIAYHLVLSRKGLNGPIAMKAQDKDKAKKMADDYRRNLEEILATGMEWFDNTDKEKLAIWSERNKKNLHADLFKSSEGSNIFVICIHGYTSSPRHMGIYAKQFYEWGYNVLMPSLRGHADSEEEFISMGWKDRLDIIEWINYLVTEYPDCKIILHGVSMGAATTMMTLGEELPENVKLAIEDCGYTNVWDILKHKMTQMKVPEFPFLYSANDINRRREKFTFKEASCTEQLKKSKTPTLFIHGEADTFVPYEMLQDVYDACPTEKDILSIPDAPHARAVCAHPEMYWPKVKEFIDKYIDR